MGEHELKTINENRLFEMVEFDLGTLLEHTVGHMKIEIIIFIENLALLGLI